MNLMLLEIRMIQPKNNLIPSKPMLIYSQDILLKLKKKKKKKKIKKKII